MIGAPSQKQRDVERPPADHSNDDNNDNIPGEENPWDVWPGSSLLTSDTATIDSQRRLVLLSSFNQQLFFSITPSERPWGFWIYLGFVAADILDLSRDKGPPFAVLGVYIAVTVALALRSLAPAMFMDRIGTSRRWQTLLGATCCWYPPSAGPQDVETTRTQSILSATPLPASLASSAHAGALQHVFSGLALVAPTSSTRAFSSSAIHRNRA
ncbi:hypothetical protein BDW66DRAFT_151855 [Aspergillus desertorum]